MKNVVDFTKDTDGLVRLDKTAKLYQELNKTKFDIRLKSATKRRNLWKRDWNK